MTVPSKVPQTGETVVLTKEMAWDINKLIEIGLPLNTRTLATRKTLDAIDNVAIGATTVIKTPDEEVVNAFAETICKELYVGDGDVRKTSRLLITLITGKEPT